MEPDLLQRIERLERQNRRMKLVGGTSLLGIVAVVLVGQAAPKPTTFDVVEAHAFVLKDKKDAVIGEFKPDAIDFPELILTTRDGTCCVSSHGLTARHGKRAAEVYVWRDSASISLADSTGAARIHMNASPIDGEDQGAFAVFGPSTKAIAGHPVPGNPSIAITESTIRLRDEAGCDRLVLGRTVLGSVTTGSKEETGPSSLVLCDKDGKVIFREPR